MEQSPKLKAKTYQCRFLEAGVVKYENEMVYISPANLLKIAESFKGTPMIVDHQDVTIQNADTIKFGNATNIRIESDGWAWCDFAADDEEPINLINSGWKVSCAYIPTSSGSNGRYHNIEYDREILDAKALHIAIVKNPRYEDAIIIENSIKENEMSKTKEKTDSFLDILKNSMEAIKNAYKKVKNEEDGEGEKEDLKEKEVEEEKENKKSKKMNEESKEEEKEKEEPKENKKLNEADEYEIDGKVVNGKTILDSFRASLKNEESKEEEKEEPKENSALLNKKEEFESGLALSKTSPVTQSGLDKFELGNKIFGKK